jgi:hypothetical protein
MTPKRANKTPKRAQTRLIKKCSFSYRKTILFEVPKPAETAPKRPKYTPEGLQDSSQRKEKGNHERISIFGVVFSNSEQLLTQFRTSKFVQKKPKIGTKIGSRKKHQIGSCRGRTHEG